MYESNIIKVMALRAENIKRVSRNEKCCLNNVIVRIALSNNETLSQKRRKHHIAKYRPKSEYQPQRRDQRRIDEQAVLL